MYVYICMYVYDYIYIWCISMACVSFGLAAMNLEHDDTANPKPAKGG